MLGRTALGRGGADLTTVLTHGGWTWLLAVPGGRVPPKRPEIDERQLQALSSGNRELLATISE